MTVLFGLDNWSAAQRESLARRLRKELGVGGAAKGGRIELQGDQRDKLVPVLRAAGYRPVPAGG